MVNSWSEAWLVEGYLGWIFLSIRFDLSKRFMLESKVVKDLVKKVKEDKGGRLFENRGTGSDSQVANVRCCERH